MSGSVSRMIHDSVNKRPSRLTSASAMPIRRAVARFSTGSRPTRMVMKTMLSMPRTISIADNVARAIHASGEESCSIIGASPRSGRARRRAGFGGGNLVGVGPRRDHHAAQVRRRAGALLRRHQRDLELAEALDLGQGVVAADEVAAQVHVGDRVLVGL